MTDPNEDDWVVDETEGEDFGMEQPASERSQPTGASDEAEAPDLADAPDEDSENILLFGDRIDDSGLSLDDLSESFAGMMSSGEDPYDESPQPETPGEAPLPSLDDDEPEELVEVSPRSILEAMLFVGHPENRPITSREVAALMRGVRPAEIDDLVVELNAIYDESEAAYRIQSEGAGYRLVLREEYTFVRERFYGKVKAAKLTQAAVDVLAVVAYHQPITKATVEETRGRPCGAILGQLVRRELLRIERTDTKPRVTTYHTTDRFLDLFGLDSLQELPGAEDL